VVELNPVTPPTPVAPTPAKSAKETNAKTKAEGESRSFEVQPGIPVPARPGYERVSIDEPGIVLRHVYNFRVGRFDHNVRSLLGYFFLLRAL
jgi:hypothetical protein